MKTVHLLCVALCLALALPVRIVLAQQPSSDRIRILVGFSAGGPTDLVARLIAQDTAGILGQPIIVENRPGADGNIAAAEVAKSQPNGSTILYNTVGLVVAPALHENPGFSPLRDFAPIVFTARIPQMIVLTPNFPARNLRELIAYIKANPGKVNVGLGALGATPHLALAQLSMEFDLKIKYIPYKGNAPAIADLVGGHVDMASFTMNSLPGYIKAKQMRPLAIMSKRRSAVLPEVPTLEEELGVPFEASSWHGMVAPAATPKVVTNRLNAAFNKALKNPKLLERFMAMGAEAVGGTSEEYGDYLRSETARWAKVVKEAGIKLE